MLSYGRQTISENDISAVVEILKSDWLTQGPSVKRFEDEFREKVGARHAIAFSSGTASLHAAAWAAGIGPGDVVYTSPLTFMATANAVRYVGGTPGLVDINHISLNLDTDQLPENPRGFMPVHFAGLPLELEELSRKLEETVIIEDAAHALGSQTPSGPVGNCSNSDMSCFSFHPVKAITTGEGGLVTTNDDDLAARLRAFRSHGITPVPSKGGWYYEISSLGFNYRMTDLQAALGVSQLRRLDEFVRRRQEIAGLYREGLRHIPQIEIPQPVKSGYSHSYHLFPILVQERDSLYSFLHKKGIRVQVHYVPVHHHPISSDVKIGERGLGVADTVYSRILSLPIYPTLTDEETNLVMNEIQHFFEEQ